MVTSWLDMWKLSGEQKSELLQMLVKVCKAQQDGKGEQKFIYQYLRSLGADDKKRLSAASEMTIAAITEAVKGVNVENLDVLMHLPAAQALKSSSPAWLEILEVYAKGDVNSFAAFTKKNKGFFDKSDLDQDQCLCDMRALTLCTLAQKTEVLTYKQLVSQLNVENPDEVENVIIEAVLSGKVKASIDQENETVIMKESTTRSFNEETDWTMLQEKLDNWRNALVNTLDTLRAE